MLLHKPWNTSTLSVWETAEVRSDYTHPDTLPSGRLRVIRARKERLKKSFFPRAVELWWKPECGLTLCTFTIFNGHSIHQQKYSIYLFIYYYRYNLFSVCTVAICPFSISCCINNSCFSCKEETLQRKLQTENPQLGFEPKHYMWGNSSILWYTTTPQANVKLTNKKNVTNLF